MSNEKNFPSGTPELGVPNVVDQNVKSSESASLRQQTFWTTPLGGFALALSGALAGTIVGTLLAFKVERNARIEERRDLNFEVAFDTLRKLYLMNATLRTIQLEYLEKSCTNPGVPYLIMNVEMSKGDPIAPIDFSRLGFLDREVGFQINSNIWLAELDYRKYIQAFDRRNELMKDVVIPIVYKLGYRQVESVPAELIEKSVTGQTSPELAALSIKLLYGYEPTRKRITSAINTLIESLKKTIPQQLDSMAPQSFDQPSTALVMPPECSAKGS